MNDDDGGEALPTGLGGILRFDMRGWEHRRLGGSFRWASVA